MNQSSRMIGMEMCEHYLAYISGSYSKVPKLRADLFFRMD
jgi:hypothetical protein